MLIILIIILIFGIVGALLVHWDCGDAIDKIFGFLIGCLVGLLPSLAIGFIISMTIFGAAPMEYKYSQDLIAMKDNTSISGSFFLGTGQIDSDLCYIYIVEADKGVTTKTIKQKSNEVYIRYTDGQPYLEYWGPVNDPWRFPNESSYYVFYLPEGSVISNVYEIDLE